MVSRFQRAFGRTGPRIVFGFHFLFFFSLNSNYTHYLKNLRCYGTHSSNNGWWLVILFLEELQGVEDSVAYSLELFITFLVVYLSALLILNKIA